MTQDNDNGDDMTRRTAMKGIGVTGAAALTGGVGLLASSGSAAAASVSLEANPVSASTQDGNITEVFLRPRGDITWENFDEVVDHLRVKFESRITDKDGNVLTGWQTAYHQTIDIEKYGGETGLTGSHSGPIGEVVLYDDGEKGGSTVHFDVSQDGGSIRRRIELRLTVELLHGDRRADPQEKALIVEEAAFYADSKNKPASSGLTATTNGEMN